MQILVVHGHPMVPLSAVIQPAALLAIFLAEPRPTPPYQRTFTVIAVLLTCLWGAMLWAAGGTLRREVAEGTLARNVTGASDPAVVVAGKCMGSTLLVLGLLLGTCTMAVTVTGVVIRPVGIPWLVLGFALTAASGAAMGFALCSIFVLTRHAIQITAALLYPVFILSGLLIPIHLIPVPLAWLSRLISLYWADQVLDRAAAGTFAPWPAFALALLTVLYFVLGRLLFERLLHLARQQGSLDIG